MEFLQGLIQLSAALVKRREGSERGEAKLMAQALEKLRAASTRAGSNQAFMGVRLEPLIDQVEEGATPTIELQV
jgi:hypothetical protein